MHTFPTIDQLVNYVRPLELKSPNTILYAWLHQCDMWWTMPTRWHGSAACSRSCYTACKLQTELSRLYSAPHRCNMSTNKNTVLLLVGCLAMSVIEFLGFFLSFFFVSHIHTIQKVICDHPPCFVFHLPCWSVPVAGPSVWWVPWSVHCRTRPRGCTAHKPHDTSLVTEPFIQRHRKRKRDFGFAFFFCFVLTQKNSKESLRSCKNPEI